MFTRSRLVQWVAGFVLGSLVTMGTASAQRTPTASAGALAADESNPKLERSSCVLMLQRGARYTGPGMASANLNALADLNALTTAMTTTGLIDPAAKAALGLGAREWPKVLRIEILPAGAQAVKLSVSVDPGPNKLTQPEPAAALLRELVDRAKAVVSQSAEPRRQEVKVRLDEIEERRAELRKSIESLRKRVREAEVNGFRVGNALADPVAIQRRQLELELSGKRPRLKAITEILPRIAAEADELKTALRGLVAAREMLVTGLEKAVEAGKAESLELLRARADLAEARVRAAEGGRTTSAPPSRNFRDERLNLEVDIAALEAQLRALPATPAETNPKPAEDPQQVRSDLMRAENENNMLESQYQQARRDYEQLGSPPTLVVLDGNAK